MKRALLVIDVQNEYFTGRLPITHPENSLDNILRVIDTAQASMTPIVVIQHTSPQANAKTFCRGSSGWELHPQIRERRYDLLLDKAMPSSFAGTNLEQWLRDRGIDTVAICGYMTQMCCDSTARDACHRGFGVEFLSDATGTLSITNAAGTVSAEELHRAILVTQAMRFGRVLSTDEWISLQEITESTAKGAPR